MRLPAVFLLGLAVFAPGCLETLAPEGLASTDDLDEDCPGHWHSSITFIVLGERVRFTPNPAYTLEGGTMPISTHMHQGSEGIWHFEPSSRECLPYEVALNRIDVAMEHGRLDLSGKYHDGQGWGGTHREDGDEALQAWLRPWQGDWAVIDVDDLVSMQVPDGAQVLVLFGAYTDVEVAEHQAAAQPLPGYPGPRDS